MASFFVLRKWIRKFGPDYYHEDYATEIGRQEKCGNGVGDHAGILIKIFFHGLRWYGSQSDAFLNLARMTDDFWNYDFTYVRSIHFYIFINLCIFFNKS